MKTYYSYIISFIILLILFFNFLHSKVYLNPYPTLNKTDWLTGKCSWLKKSYSNCIFVSFALFLWFKEQNWQAFSEKFPRLHRLILWFSSLSYGVYLGHILILDCLKNGYFGFWASSTHFFWWDLHPIIAIPLVFLTTVILTTALITGLSKIPFLGKWVG